MAWSVVSAAAPVVHLVNDEGNVAEAIYDESADPHWTVRLRYVLGTAPESFDEVVDYITRALTPE